MVIKLYELCVLLFQPFNEKPETSECHEVDFIDIAFDEYPEKHYVKEEVDYIIVYRQTRQQI